MFNSFRASRLFTFPKIKCVLWTSKILLVLNGKVEIKNIPNLLHGEAVALDCLLSSCLSFSRGYFKKSSLENIFEVAKKLKLPTYHEDFCNFSLIKESLNDACKHRNGNQHITLPLEIGRYKIVDDVTDVEIKKAIRVFRGMK